MKARHILCEYCVKHLNLRWWRVRRDLNLVGHMVEYGSRPSGVPRGVKSFGHHLHVRRSTWLSYGPAGRLSSLLGK